MEAGDFAAAIQHFQAAIEKDPRNGHIRYHLARANRQAGQAGDAIIEATKALSLNPELVSAARFLATLLAQVQLKNPCGMDSAGLASAFHFTDVDRQVLAPPAIAYLKSCTPLADAILLGGASGWDVGAQWLLSSKGRPVLRDPLFQAVLGSATISDLDMERLLTAARKALLMAPLKESLRKPHLLEFSCFLAKQMEINEYLFPVSIEEQDQLEKIVIKPEILRKGSRAVAECLLLKAMYAPVWRLLGDDGQDLDTRIIKPKVLADLIDGHLTERNAEISEARDIPSIGSIDDDVSLNVARLYEENPYPRWLSLNTPEAGQRRIQMALHFDEEELAFMDHPFRVLIAGSGTGQQTTDAALAYGPDANLTAIDLSLASLAYAKRMARRFDANNIQFLQCDILNAGQLDDTFDIIECIGVLHHMDEPFQGWRVLVDKLRPGGFMKIGLYSELARRDIAALRKDIMTRNLGDDEQTLRDFRQQIINQGDDGKNGFLRQSADFYSLSNFRDLLFHVSEQHMTIPGIERFLADNGLAFHGFQLPSDIEEGYPADNETNDLLQWATFEESHPDTFKGMYVFWCRKALE